MKYIRGFLMAWGNFSAVPCPYRKWHEEARRAMLCMLPMVGIMLAIFASVCWFILDLINAPAMLTGMLVSVVYFCATGFIHVDGFMDCSDAIMSRRPELEQRQKILKDSHVGAFAVVSFVIGFVVFAISMTVIVENFSVENAAVLVLVMAFSRFTAVEFIRKKPSMKTSQYADIANKSPDKNKFAMDEVIVQLIIMIVLLATVLIFLASGSIINMIVAIAVTVITVVTAFIRGRAAIKQLGGMSGDVAGYMMVSAEIAGVTAMALIMAATTA